MTSPMKDSGVDWIGKIPEEWGIAKAKYYFTNDKEAAGALADQLPRLALTLNGVVDRPKDDANGLQPKEFTGYQIFDRNDLVFKLIDLQNISTSRVGLVPKRGIMSGAYIRLIGRATISPNYSQYFYLSMWHRQIFNKLGDDGVRSSLSVSDLLNLPITTPPLDEQKRIASFLDKTCNEIDKLSTDIQSQIDKLAEYKKSIITHAVTKGLDPNAQMKDSGVDWIGKMPEEWNHVPLKYLIHKRISGSWGKDPRQNSNDMLCMRIADFEYCKIAFKNKPVDDFTVRNYTQSEIKLKTLHRDDILIEKSGGGEKTPVGRAVVYRLNHKALFANFMECLRFNKLLVDVEYIKYVLFTAYNAGETSLFITQTTGIQNINTTRFLSKTHSPLPPLNEQKQIADYLDDKCSDIDGVIEIKKKQLDKLAEYKKSIIYEYTTGKKRIKE